MRVKEGWEGIVLAYGMLLVTLVLVIGAKLLFG